MILGKGSVISRDLRRAPRFQHLLTFDVPTPTPLRIPNFFLQLTTVFFGESLAYVTKPF